MLDISAAEPGALRDAAAAGLLVALVLLVLLMMWGRS